MAIPQLSGPLPPTPSVLQGVSCASSTDCVAVGSVTSMAGTVPLVEQWNGTSWTLTSLPGPGGSVGSVLRSVSCVGASFCEAVGDSVQGSNTVTLAEQWNGSAWSVVSSPNGSNAGGASNSLQGVSCVGASFCQAVGHFSDGVNPQRTLIESWDGATWSLAPSPNVSPTQSDGLSGVDCFSQTTCSAVGLTHNPSTAFNPMAVVWDGSAWSIVAAPNRHGECPDRSERGLLRHELGVRGRGRTNNGGVIDPFAMSAPIARSGYRFVASDGGIFNYGSGAPFLGSMGGTPLNKPVVGMAVMPAGDGYYLVASDGGIFNFGSAQFYGSTGSIHLNKPIVGMAVTTDGGGLLARRLRRRHLQLRRRPVLRVDGQHPPQQAHRRHGRDPRRQGLLARGLRRRHLQLRRRHLLAARPAPSCSTSPWSAWPRRSSGGYYLVATDGGIFTYPTTGGPPFYGSTGSHRAQQAHRGDDDRGRRLLPERLGRRDLHLPDHRRPAVLRLDGLHRPQRAHRGDRRIGRSRAPGGAGPAAGRAGLGTGRWAPREGAARGSVYSER